jgi:hypothetical protein
MPKSSALYEAGDDPMQLPDHHPAIQLEPQKRA